MENVRMIRKRNYSYYITFPKALIEFYKWEDKAVRVIITEDKIIIERFFD